MPGRGGEAYHCRTPLYRESVYDSRKPYKIGVHARNILCMSYVLIQAKVCYSLIRFRVNHSTWDYYFECRNIQGSGHASRTLLLLLLWNQSMIGSFWTKIYFLRSRHGGPLVTQKSKLSAIKNSFGEFGPKVLGIKLIVSILRFYHNRIYFLDPKISHSQSDLSRSYQYWGYRS